MKRIPRINELIRKELNQILIKEIDFPQEVLITITRVETFSNLKEAQVFISVLPENRTSEVMKNLNSRIYELQRGLNQRVEMRIVPRIKFITEEKTKTAARIEELLEKIKQNDQ